MLFERVNNMGNIILKEMSLQDYNDYTESAISNYTEELLLSGRFKNYNEALDFSKLEYYDVFKDGFQTKDIFLYNINLFKENIGIVWFIKEKNWGFIGDFLIYKEYRGNKHGYNTLMLLEDKAKECGIKELRLGVFKHNLNAIKLYLKVGYTILKDGNKNYIMAKKLNS